MKVKVNKVQIQIVEGDILDVSGSALVMVTDTNLNLDPDLLARGGAELALARQQIGWARVGSAVSTPAGKLPYQRLIYAIGPRWGEGSERGKLAYVVFHCLREAEEHGLRSGLSGDIGRCDGLPSGKLCPHHAGGNHRPQLRRVAPFA
jgi:O-acetyl-ADP-ribose deacetylase (regulator of RNase III)